MCVRVGDAAEMSDPCLGPLDGAPHGLSGRLVSDGIRQALVQHHEDVAAKRQLNVDGRLRREQMSIAVQVRTEQHALIAHLAQAVQAEHLKAARVGQNGPVPGHEAVQAAHSPDQLVPGTEE